MKSLLLGLVSFVAVPCLAGDVQYAPGGKTFAKAWNEFYTSFHEPDIDDPLINRGSSMIPFICAAIRHKDMDRRRYAIAALGQMKEKKIIPFLEMILKDTTEKAYFREDALHSIYRLDQELGYRYAQEYKDADMKWVTEAILSRDPEFLEPTQEAEPMKIE